MAPFSLRFSPQSLGVQHADHFCRASVASHRPTDYAQIMADKMRLYAGDEDVDLEELERALTIVRRNMVNPESCPGFLENPEVRGQKRCASCTCTTTHPQEYQHTFFLLLDLKQRKGSQLPII